MILQVKSRLPRQVEDFPSPQRHPKYQEKSTPDSSDTGSARNLITFLKSVEVEHENINPSNTFTPYSEGTLMTLGKPQHLETLKSYMVYYEQINNLDLPPAQWRWQIKVYKDSRFYKYNAILVATLIGRGGRSKTKPYPWNLCLAPIFFWDSFPYPDKVHPLPRVEG